MSMADRRGEVLGLPRVASRLSREILLLFEGSDTDIDELGGMAQRRGTVQCS